MGFIADLFSSSKDPVNANINAAATPEQLAAAQGNTQNALGQQNAFVNALQGQNGIQNQSNVYNQLQGIANGTAPNPALDAQNVALANATGANVANQAAMMAGQRGASANAGLMARQAAMQGGAIQQQAAGQGAQMQGNLIAQQQANALNQMGNISGQQVGNLGNANNAAAQTALQQQQNLIGGMNGTNNANVANADSINKANSADNKASKDVMGSLINAGGSALSMLSDKDAKTNVKSGEGAVKQLLDKAQPKEYNYKDAANGQGKHVSPMAQDLEKSEIGKSMVMDTPQGKVVDYGKGFGAILAAQSMLHKRLDSLEKSMKPDSSEGVAEESEAAPVDHKGPKSKLGQHFAQGGRVSHVVPGKAKVAGDSLKNDTVDAKLSPGEIVIPRSIATSKNAPAEAAKFVAACLAKSAKRKK